MLYLLLFQTFYTQNKSSEEKIKLKKYFGSIKPFGQAQFKVQKNFVKPFSPTQIKIQPENVTFSKLLVKQKLKFNNNK
jgi:hypothetical protein